MKAAFLVVIVSVLSLQGSETSIPPIGVVPPDPVNTGLLNVLLNVLLSIVKTEIQIHLKTDEYAARLCQVIGIVPDVPDASQWVRVGSNLQVTAKVHLNCREGSIDANLTVIVNKEVADITWFCPFADGPLHIALPVT